MGKIRIKTIGDEAAEEAEKQKKAVKKAEKQARETAVQETSENQDVANDLNAPIANEADLSADLSAKALASEEDLASVETSAKAEPAIDDEALKQKKVKKSKFAKKARGRSSKYKSAVMEIDKNKSYPLGEALELLKKIKIGKFDETVELHINTTEAGISGTVKLPHGTGKEIRVAIADENVLAEVEKGKINFDILIAEPTMMPKLARVAKVLGPRGLMPNPKNGTISDNPQEAMKKFQGGQISFKTESKVPLIHLTVGKISFGDDKLSENIKTIITAVKKDRIRKVTLKSTMSPAIHLLV